MAKITTKNLLDTFEEVSITKRTTISRDLESKGTDTISATIKNVLDGCTLSQVIDRAVKDSTIQFANKARKWSADIWASAKKTPPVITIRWIEKNVGAVAPLPTRASIEEALGIPLSEEQYKNMQEKGIVA